jgi:mRNA interferase HicA
MKLEGLLRHLRRHGCVLRREGKEHALWENPQTGHAEAVPRHAEIVTSSQRGFAASFRSPIHADSSRTGGSSKVAKARDCRLRLAGLPARSVESRAEQQDKLLAGKRLARRSLERGGRSNWDFKYAYWRRCQAPWRKSPQERKSLIPQGLHRIDFDRSSGWNQSRRHGDGEHQQGHCEKGLRIGSAHPEQKAPQEPRHSESGGASG